MPKHPILILAQLRNNGIINVDAECHDNALQFLACRPTTGSHGVHQQQDPICYGPSVHDTLAPWHASGMSELLHRDVHKCLLKIVSLEMLICRNCDVSVEMLICRNCDFAATDSAILTLSRRLNKIETKP